MMHPGILLGLFVCICVVCLLLFRPKQGIYWLYKEYRRKSQRVLTEDALKHLYGREQQGERATIASVCGALQISERRGYEVVRMMNELGLSISPTDGLHLTPQGRDYALRIIRTHRLFERYLSEHTGTHRSEWHHLAEKHEHELSPDQVIDLVDRLGDPTHDPHGDPIPDAMGRLHSGHNHQVLNAAPLDIEHEIVHIEDEPHVVYEQIVALGWNLGTRVRIVERGDQRLRVWADGDEHIVAPLIAANVSVCVASEPYAGLYKRERLSSLELGDNAIIDGISRGCMGLERRRLLDLGFTPGTPVKASLRSPSGDPTAYTVRNTLIALREELAQQIFISSKGTTTTASQLAGKE